MNIKAGLQKAAHLALRVFLKLHCGYRVRGQAPLRGPSLLVANHASHLDIAAIFAALPISEVPKVRTAAARDSVYAYPAPLVAAVEFLFNTFAFERKTGSSSSLEQCSAFLKEGYHVAIFPEGRRSEDGSFLGFTPGFAKVAYQTGAPVVPIRIEGAHRALPRGTFVLQRRPFTVEFRKPLHADTQVPYPERREAYARLVREADTVLCA
jgi:1-acyl-sn-glycerol-3-phosphate acyltransferase